MKITTKIGSHVSIDVSSPAEALDAAADFLGSHSGVISSDDPDFVFRRKRGAAAIKFFDVGQIKNGSGWRTPETFVAPALPPSAQVREIAAGDYVARDQIFLSATTPSETFRQIKKDAQTAKYNVALAGSKADGEPVFFYSLSSEEAKFSNDGLALSAGEISAAKRVTLYGNEYLFKGAQICGDGANKITATPDPAAEPVNYSLGKLDKFFLMPRFVFSSGTARISANFAPNVNKYFVLNQIYTIFPRAVFVDPQSAFFNTQIIGSANHGSTAAIYALVYKAVRFAKSLAGSRGFVTNDTFGEPFSFSSSGFPPAQFPPPPAVMYNDGAFTALDIAASMATVIEPADQLLVVIERSAGERFFVWSS